MSRTWFIPATGVHGAAPRTQLIGCSLVRNSATKRFEFYGPGPTPKLEATSAVISMPVTGPFWFPKFHSALNGTVSRDWYIKVSDVDTGPFSDFCDGRWSNTAPPPLKDDGNTDPDTWVTQAGVGIAPDEGDEAVAASASAKQ